MDLSISPSRSITGAAAAGSAASSSSSVPPRTSSTSAMSAGYKARLASVRYTRGTRTPASVSRCEAAEKSPSPDACPNTPASPPSDASAGPASAGDASAGQKSSAALHT